MGSQGAKKNLFQSSFIYSFLFSLFHVYIIILKAQNLCMIFASCLTLHPRICTHGSMVSILNGFLKQKKQTSHCSLSAPVLYLRRTSLFDAMLSLSKSLISGVPHPSVAREHLTYPSSGWLRLLYPYNDKAHEQTVNGKLNPNTQNSLKSKTTSTHWAGRTLRGL